MGLIPTGFDPLGLIPTEFDPYSVESKVMLFLMLILTEQTRLFW
jgi:hypothetical protein